MGKRKTTTDAFVEARETLPEAPAAGDASGSSAGPTPSDVKKERAARVSPSAFDKWSVEHLDRVECKTRVQNQWNALSKLNKTKLVYTALARSLLKGRSISVLGVDPLEMAQHLVFIVMAILMLAFVRAPNAIVSAFCFAGALSVLCALWFLHQLQQELTKSRNARVANLVRLLKLVQLKTDGALPFPKINLKPSTGKEDQDESEDDDEDDDTKTDSIASFFADGYIPAL